MRLVWLVILLILIGCGVSFLIDNHAYGLYFPTSPDDLLEQSQAIFVGNITKVNVLEFEKSSSYIVSKDGIDETVIENYTLYLDEYTVNIEEFVKNQLQHDTITIRQPTISLPGQIGGHVSFELGDRVLFYVKNLDGTNTYSPESFEIPAQCDTNSVLTQNRIKFANNFSMIQDDVLKEDNFTANVPIHFSYERDDRTLDGYSYNFTVGISKATDNSNILYEELELKAEPCQWVSSATWEFVPDPGKYRMNIHIFENDGDFSSSTHFTVKEKIDYEKIPWDEFSQNNRAVIYTKNSMSPLSILEKGQQYSIVQEVDFSDDNFAENSTFSAVVGYAYQKGDKMIRPPRGENVTDADHQEFAEYNRKLNNNFYQHSEIAKSFEFKINSEKPFYIKSSLSFAESGLYTHQYYEKLKNSPAVMGSNMGGLTVVDKFSKAVDDSGVCKNENFRRLIKHDYSTLVCVDSETAWKLIERGWGL